MFFREVSPANQPASSVQVKADPPAAPPVPRKLQLWLTFGVAGTVLFPIIYVIEGATRPDYDAWQQAISALSLGPGGWIQQFNFALCVAKNARRRRVRNLVSDHSWDRRTGTHCYCDLLAGLWTMVFMIFFVLAQNTYSVLTGYSGLFERLATISDTIWSVVLVGRLWVRRSTGI